MTKEQALKLKPGRKVWLEQMTVNEQTVTATAAPVVVQKVNSHFPLMPDGMAVQVNGVYVRPGVIHTSMTDANTSMAERINGLIKAAQAAKRQLASPKG